MISNIPHDNDDKFHDDVVEDVEEVHHHLTFTAHPAEEDTEARTEEYHT